MFLHIGKDKILKTEDIIGIFDLEILENSNISKEFLKNFNKNYKIEDLDEIFKKSFIIYDNNKKLEGYISNISSLTLGKRKSTQII